jgi:hypothetical protein
MAISNQSSTLSGNGEAYTPSTKKKEPRKSSSSVKEQGPKAAKRSTARATGPMEILFTQEADPYQTPVPPYIWIDFPTQSEALSSTQYVVRLGVGGADLVEISIDKSPWLPCRLTSGYWWYDWSKIARGKHALVARMRASDGRWFKTPLRQCDYRPE